MIAKSHNLTAARQDLMTGNSGGGGELESSIIAHFLIIDHFLAGDGATIQCVTAEYGTYLR